MGDLAHELESLITGIELGTVPPSSEARTALQQSLDELSRMRDLLAAERAHTRIRARWSALVREAVSGGAAAWSRSLRLRFSDTSPEPRGRLSPNLKSRRLRTSGLSHAAWACRPNVRPHLNG